MRRGAGGFALILVIWALVLLTSLATGFALAIRHEIRVAGDLASIAQAEATTSATLHAAAFMLGASYALRHDAHVRIDIFREKMSARTRALVELMGCLTILLPISAILIYHGADSALTAFLGGETPEAFSGLPIQWVVKSTVPVGYLLLFLSGACVMTRNFLFLIGKEPAPAPQGELFAQHIRKGASDS